MSVVKLSNELPAPKGWVRAELEQDSSWIRPLTAEEITDDIPLFGPGSLGLDSVDALQLVVALDKHFGLKISEPAAAKEILQSVNTMAAALEKNFQKDA